MNRRSLMRVAALAAMLALGAPAPAAHAVAPYVPPGQAPVAAAPVEFDGRVLVRIQASEAAAVRAEAGRGLERMRAVSPVLRGLSATHTVRSAGPVVPDALLYPEARAVGLDRWILIEVDPAAGFPAVAARLRSTFGVEAVEQDRQAITLTVAPNDSLFTKNWGHGNTATFPSFSFGTLLHTGPNVGTIGFDANVQGGWAAPAGFGSASVVVAILDTGVDPTHPDLSQVAGYDYHDNDANPADTQGHGTACAGVAAGIANNTRGVAGSAGGCKIMPLRISDGSTFFLSAMINAINYAATNGAEVASFSLEVGRVQSIADALTAAEAAGVVLVAATGNNNGSVLPFPANHPKVIAVGAASPCASRKRSSNNPGLVNPGVTTDSLGVSCDNETFWGSTWGVAVPNDSAAVDILGPTMLPTTDIQGAGGFTANGYNDFFNGTSCATPYVAGVAALIRSQHPTWTPAQVRQRLVETAIDIVDAQTPAGWDKYTGYGMVNAGLPDLLPFAIGGWSSSVVPRPVADATIGSVPAPATLNGDVNSFVSALIANLGEATSGLESFSVTLDGGTAFNVAHNTIVGGGSYVQNVGLNVRGGRHVVGLDADPDGSLPESNELNNREGHQWSWTPTSFGTSANTVISRLAPPSRNGGRPDVPVSETTYDNVDAVRMVGPALGSSTQFWVIGLHASDTATDLDLRLHAPTTTATDGFTPGNLLAASAYGSGYTDWAIALLGNYPVASFDAASLQYAGGVGQSRFESRLSEGIVNVFNGSTIVIPGVAFTNDMMVAVHDLRIDAPGPVTLELNSTGPLHMALYDPATTLSVRTAALQVSAPVFGVERLSRTLAGGRHPIVVYRDPTEGTGPLTYTITVRRTPAELATFVAGGTYAPSGVFKNGVGNNAAPPTVLDGNVNSTVYWYSYQNTGPTQATGFQVRETLDGVNIFTWTPGGLSAGFGATWISSLRNIRGGRHTMGYENDITGAIAEFDETNNDHASQWVWSPLPLALEVPVSRPNPPDPTGGWSDVPALDPKYSNVDGLRTPVLAGGVNDGYWSFFAAAPRVGTHDPDLGAYQPISSGPADGFTTPADQSGRPAGRVDFVGVDVDGNPRAVDLGLFNTAGAGDVVVHGAYSRWAFGDIGLRGPYTLGPDSLIAVLEFETTPGTSRQVRLRNLSGNADLELFTFERNDGSMLYNPTQAVASSDQYGDGGDEVLQTTFSTRFPAVVVTKRGSGDIGKTSIFTIEIGNSTVDVPEELPLPTAVRLAPVTPNPVSAAATIAFELPRESAVELSAYDVAGRRVATLASGTWQAGRHAVRWAPQGTTGARLASGVYLLRLEAAGVQMVQRVVVTK